MAAKKKAAKKKAAKPKASAAAESVKSGVVVRSNVRTRYANAARVSARG